VAYVSILSSRIWPAKHGNIAASDETILELKELVRSMQAGRSLEDLNPSIGRSLAGSVS
jgi:hypothetical protein